MPNQTKDIIPLETAKTLDGLFRERCRRTPELTAYRTFHRKTKTWQDRTWGEMATQTTRWQKALEAEELQPGDRVAIMVRNCPEWVMMDQAALGLGLVVVPLYCNDRPENVAYIIENAGVKLFFIEGIKYWKPLKSLQGQLKSLTRILVLEEFDSQDVDSRLLAVDQWLPEQGDELKEGPHQPSDLATIVYTSGTTGNPKGVKLSHHNILWNAFSGVQAVTAYQEDLFLSFLPMSHTFERTVGYYLPIMSGSTVAYARSVQQIAEDLLTVQPTIMISVPRIFERVYSKIKSQLEKKSAVERFLFKATVWLGWNRFLFLQKRKSWCPKFLLWPLLDKLVASKVRERLGGNIRLVISGGAALPKEVGRVFISLGVTILQGFGMTETSPVTSVNRLDNNDPSGVGLALQDVEVKIGDKDELLVKSPGVMLGYWNNDDATGKMMDEEGWLHTGDKARIEEGHIYITGRIKEIIVMGNGEKVPPADIEMAIAMDPLIEQVMVVGEGKPYLAALVVLNEEQRAQMAAKLGFAADSLDFFSDKRAQKLVAGHVARQMHAFPGYAKVRRVTLIQGAWTIDNGLMTPTLKLRRNRILETYTADIERLYEGHEV